MPIDAPRVWLTEETCDRARIELALLRMERATGTHRGHSDREQRALRIRQLHELIATAAVGHEPPDHDVAERGMVLTVCYEADDLTYRVASPGLSCSSSTRPLANAITVWRSTCSCPPNTVFALRPLDAERAAVRCSRAMAVNDIFCIAHLLTSDDGPDASPIRPAGRAAGRSTVTAPAPSRDHVPAGRPGHS